MKVYPLIGIDECKFGMARDEVEGRLGLPDRIEKSNNEINWLYDDLGVELSFMESDAFNLSYISINSKNAEINGIKPIGITTDDLLSKMKELNIALEWEEWEEGHDKYFNDAVEIVFWVLDRAVYQIAIFPKE